MTSLHLNLPVLNNAKLMVHLKVSRNQQVEGGVDHQGSQRMDLGVVQGGEGLKWDSQVCLALLL